ncbi:MAG: hypothetical protein WAK29_01460, partial [Terriglobales bacterium]
DLLTEAREVAAWAARGGRMLSQACVNAERFGGFAEAFISCPKKCRRTNQDGGYQVGVGEANAEAVQAAGFDHSPHFAQLSDLHLRQEVQKGQRFGAVV